MNPVYWRKLKVLKKTVVVIDKNIEIFKSSKETKL